MPTILRYGIAVLSVAIAIGLDFFLLRYFEAILTPFLFAVAATVWYAGTGPGVLAIVLSVLSLNYFFLHSFFSSPISYADLVYLTFCTFCALAVGWVSAVRRRTEQELRRPRGARRQNQPHLRTLSARPYLIGGLPWPCIPYHGGGRAKMERCALSNGDWIRAAANAIAFSRTGHAAAAPKHQSRCNVWMGGHGEFKCGATWHVRARPQSSVMRFDNRPADRQPKPQTARFRGVEGLEHALKSRRC